MKYSIPMMARLLGGEARGSRIRCAGPGHSKRDRSLEVWINPDAPGGYLVHSFADDDPIACRDYVRNVLGLEPWQGEKHQKPIARCQARNEEPDQEVKRRREVSRWLWENSKEGLGTLAEAYLKSRGISLSSWPATLRFLPANPPKHLWPALVAAYALPTESEPAMLTVRRADIAGVQLTYLNRDGSGKAPIEPQKRSIGRDHNMPIVLAPMTDGLALVIAEGIEDALSLHLATGLAAWAAGGASRLPALAEAVPSYVEAVTIAADGDTAGRRGATELGDALDARGICVRVLLSNGSGDVETGS